MNFTAISVIILAAIGAALGIYQYKNRESTTVSEDDPDDHIRGMYILKIPYEKIVIGYFGLMFLAFLVDLILGGNPEMINLIFLLISGFAFLLFLYKVGLSFIDTVQWKLGTVMYAVLNLIIAVIKYYDLQDPVGSMGAALEYLLTFHLLGMIFGLGGTFILDILIFHFLRNFKISTQEAVIMHLISQLIVIGLFLLIVTGAAIYLTDVENYSNSSRFLMKMTAVLVLTINGLFLNFYMMPKIKKLSMVKEKIERDQTLKRIAFAVGAVSMVSWFAAFFLAMVKDLSAFSYIEMLIPYLILLAGAIGAGQFTKKQMEDTAEEES